MGGGGWVGGGVGVYRSSHISRCDEDKVKLLWQVMDWSALGKIRIRCFTYMPCIVPRGHCIQIVVVS